MQLIRKATPRFPANKGKSPRERLRRRGRPLLWATNGKTLGSKAHVHRDFTKFLINRKGN